MASAGWGQHEFPRVEICGSAYGERSGAPLVLSCRDLPYALLFNPAMNHGYVVDLEHKRLHRMDDDGAIGVAYGGSRSGDDMESPYDVGGLDGVCMYRDCFSIQDGGRTVYLDWQGKLLGAQTSDDNGPEPSERDADALAPQGCLARFEQFTTREVNGDPAPLQHHADVQRRGDSPLEGSTLYVYDNEGNELWHKDTRLYFPDRHNHAFSRVVSGKVYLHDSSSIRSYSPESEDDIIYTPLVSKKCITHNYTCQTGEDDCIFIRLSLLPKASYWEIVHVHRGDIRRSRVAIHDPEAFLYRWCEQESQTFKRKVIPDELTPQMVGGHPSGVGHIILLTGKTQQQWEYTRHDADGASPGRVISDAPLFFHYSRYLKAYLATTKGRVRTTDTAEPQVVEPARMYFLPSGDPFSTPDTP